MGLADDAVRGLNAPEMPPACPPFKPATVIPEWLVAPALEPMPMLTLTKLLDAVLKARNHYRYSGPL